MNNNTNTQNIDESQVLKINEDNLNRVINWIAVADSKAKFILTILLIALSYVVTQAGIIIDSAIKIAAKSEQIGINIWLLLGILIIGAIPLLLSLLFLIRIIYPDLKRKKKEEADECFFFQLIAQKDASEFYAKMKDISKTQTIDGIIYQTYNASYIAKIKYSQLKVSIICFFIGLFIIGILAILSRFWL